MLQSHINQFFDYCRLADFSIRSVQALTARLNEFNTFLKKQRIRSIKKVAYRHLVGFVADYKAPSIHVTKSRVWVMRQFYHFLTLHRIIPKNIATGIPCPNIDDQCRRRVQINQRLDHPPVKINRLETLEELPDPCSPVKETRDPAPKSGSKRLLPKRPLANVSRHGICDGG